MQTKIMIKSFFVNSSLVVVKFIVGLLGRSSALIADAVHSLSDLLTDIFALFGIRQANKPPDQEHPFGHGKVEYVVTLFLGLGILGVSIQLILSVINQLDEEVLTPSPIVMVVSIGVIIVKYILSRYLINQGNKIESQIVKASGEESFADVFSSVIVIVGVGLVFLSNTLNIPWLIYADRFASLVIAAFIIRIGLKIIYGAIESILGKSASLTLYQDTKAHVENIPGVYRVDHLDIIVYGHYYQVLIEIRVDGSITVKEGHDIAHFVKKSLQKTNPKFNHVIVHVNPEEE